MVISYVLRLRPDSLADGSFVGEIEAVSSQERTRIRTLEQMTTFILSTLESQVCSGSTARQLATEDSEEPKAERRLGQ
ncbi:MAG: hypothetical protein ACRDXC_09515 [Acidimicrobiales bacterium]